MAGLRYVSCVGRRVLYAAVLLSMFILAESAPVLSVEQIPFGAPKVAWAQPNKSENEPAHLTHGPVVGAVTDTNARVFVRTDRRAAVKVRFGRTPTLQDAIESTGQSTRAAHDFAGIVPLKELEPATVYYLDVVVDGVPQLAAPYPQFKTFPVRGSAASFKFVVFSDLHAPIANVGTFGTASLEEPAFVIIGGDLGHGNQDTVFEKRAAFKQLYTLSDKFTWVSEFVSKILYKFPVAHMWDDHDFGANNANKTYPYKAASYQVLNEYFPVYPLSPYGDWQKFSYAQADFFLLDSRSQRDPNGKPDGPLKSMLDGDNLGEKGQLHWLKQGLLKSKATWKFIVTPVVFNKTSRKEDSWYGFRHERDALAQFIREHSISGVILLSGDAHVGGLDDGSNSHFPEMLTPGANLPACSSANRLGKWSQGIYWTGEAGATCNGYGLVSVQADPPQVKLEVKDTQGKTKLELDVNP